MNWASQRCELTLGFGRSAAWTAANLQTIADHCATWWNTALKPLLGGNLQLTEVYARSLESDSAPTYTSTLYSTTLGTASGTAYIPQNCAFVVTFRTAQRGRANRGRNYFPVCLQTQLGNAGIINTTFRDSLLTAYRRLLPGGASDPTPAYWVVISRQLNGVVGGRKVPIIAVASVDDYIDSQRRRLRGRGL